MNRILLFFWHIELVSTAMLYYFQISSFPLTQPTGLDWLEQGKSPSSRDDPMPKAPQRETLNALLLGLLTLAGLMLLSSYDFLLFHTVAELFSIVIASCVFILAWSSRHNVESSAFTLLGIAYLCVAVLDGIHTLSYEGMPFFQAYAPNLPTQIWISTRYLEALSLLAFALLLGRKFALRLPILGYGLLTAGLFLLLLTRTFPDCFIPGQGLTGFKIGSEYLIILILLAAIAALAKRRQHFDTWIFRLIVLSLTTTILAELAFTFYVSVYGHANLIGHFLKIVSFFLIYKAIVATGITRPQDLLFRKLQESEKRYDSLTSNLSGIAFRSHLDWSPVYVRGAVEEITGYSQEDFLQGNITWQELLHPQDLQDILGSEAHSELWSRPGYNAYREYRILPKHGGVRWLFEGIHNVLNDRGQPVYLEGVALDLTRQKQRELELNKLRLAVENSPVPIVITNTQGDMEYVNPAFTQITGYVSQEAVGQNPRILKSGEHGQDFYRELWETISSGRTWRGEFHNRKKSGELYWERAAIAPVKDQSGQIINYVGVKEDVTQEKDLERIKTDVERIMRHDLKTPLNGIIGLPQVLLQEDNLSEEQREMLGFIEQTGWKMLNMIDLSLDMFKMELGSYEYQPQQVDLLRILRQLITDNQSRLKPSGLKAKLLVQGLPPAPEDSVPVQAEERLLYTMLANLLVNAIEASPQGREIALEVTLQDQVLLCITNQGAVPRSVQNTFFTKYSTSAKEKGTGLGTYSAWLTAQTMGFDIQLEVDEQQDLTRVKISMPSLH